MLFSDSEWPRTHILVLLVVRTGEPDGNVTVRFGLD